MLDIAASDPGARGRFDREREVLAALAMHPHIMTVYDAGIQDGRPWLAMELCRRGSLGAYVATHGPLDAGTGLAVLVAVATSLSAAHERGVLHGRITPANILLTDYGEPVVDNVGSARLSHSAAVAPDHVAPELLLDGRCSTATRRLPRNDALGAVHRATTCPRLGCDGGGAAARRDRSAPRDDGAGARRRPL